MEKSITIQHYPKNQLTRKDYNKLLTLQDESIQEMRKLKYSYDLEKNIKTFIRYCNYFSRFNSENRLILIEEDKIKKTRYTDSINLIYYTLRNFLNEFNYLLEEDIKNANPYLKIIYYTLFLKETRSKEIIFPLINESADNSNILLSVIDDLVDKYSDNDLWPSLEFYQNSKIDIMKSSITDIRNGIRDLKISTTNQSEKNYDSTRSQIINIFVNDQIITHEQYCQTSTKSIANYNIAFKESINKTINIYSQTINNYFSTNNQLKIEWSLLESFLNVFFNFEFVYEQILKKENREELSNTKELTEKNMLTKEDVSIFISKIKKGEKIEKGKVLSYFISKYNRRMFLLFIHIINNDNKIIPLSQKKAFTQNLSALNLRNTSESTIKIFISKSESKKDYFQINKYNKFHLLINIHISFYLKNSDGIREKVKLKKDEYLEYIRKLIEDYGK